jgi:hypothetical protein
MRTVALRVLIGSVVISALVGIYILTIGHFGDLEVRVLVTALSISGLSILAMACGAAFERGRVRPLPHLGVAVSVTSFLLFMIGIWSESDWQPLWKTALSLAFVGVAAAHACLLSLATLSPRFHWTQWLGLTSAFLLVAMLIFFVWAEVDSEGLWRVVGVLAILVGAVTIGVPVLHRMSAPSAAPAAATQESSSRYCVACGSSVASGTDVLRCHQCGAHFRVKWSTDS